MRSGEQRCALPIETVLRAAPAVAASPLPRVPSWVEGIAAYDRDLVPQIALSALIGGGSGGALAVVATSGAGAVALRVDAIERVIDLVERPAADTASRGVVSGTVRRGRHEVVLLDLTHLAVPVTELVPAIVSVSGRVVQQSLARAEPDAVPLDLVCALDDGFIALPLARVASVETAGPGMILHDPFGRPAPPQKAAMAVTVSLARGSLVLGVGTIVGLRRPGSPGYRDAHVIDCDALAGPAGAAALPDDPAGSQTALQERVMYLLSAGGRLALVPGAKALRVGPVEHWCALPGDGPGPDGLLPLGSAILPGLDLGRLFGDPVRPRAMAMALYARGSQWAIACDSISERHGRIEGRPVTRDGLALLGQVQIAEGLVPVLDTDRLVLPGQGT